MGKTFGTYDKLYVARIKFLEEPCPVWTHGLFEIRGFKRFRSNTTLVSYWS
jgi:hypothetical protein